jgi:2-oxoisovalerate dehydrogenase E1 component
MNKQTILKAFKNLVTAKSMAELYEDNFKVVSKYVHATSRGHEVIQTAVGMQLQPQDFVYPYYRDDAMLLAIGMQPKDLMLQLLAKKEDPFSGGRTYYSHPSLRDDDKPKIPHQSSATGMQAIPATGAALALKYVDKQNKALSLGEGLGEAIPPSGVRGLVLCSLGDASVTEGEVAEAFQMAALKQLPIIYLIQDNEWDISASAQETRAQNAFEYIKGFHGIEAVSIDGTDFEESYSTLEKVIETVRTEQRPFLVHAKCPLLNHHTSGVRMEFYRDDLEESRLRDPYPKFVELMKTNGFSEKDIDEIENQIRV